MMNKRHLAVILPALVGVASLCFGQSVKLAPDLAGRDPEALLNVIVQYKQQPQQRHIDAVLGRGGRYLRKLNVVKGAVYSIAAKELAGLANDPDVAYISPDRTVKAASSLQSDYKLQAVGASNAQLNGYNGAGVGIAIIDSGITNRPDFHGGSAGFTSAAVSTSSAFSSGYRVVYAQNMINGGSTDDAYGHGTHVAGIAAGDGSQSNGVYAGVAPQADLINLVVLDNTGSSTDSVVIAGIQQAIELQSQYNI